jgi:O-antigen/teichoic acid export membrane protein
MLWKTKLIPRLAKNYLWLSGAEVVSKLASAFAFIYLARIFGPTVYGYLEFTLAIIFVASLLVDSGLGNIGARETAKDLSMLNRLLIEITLLRSILAVMACLALILLAIRIIDVKEVQSLLLWYSLTLFLLPLLILWVFQGQERMKVVAIASITRWSVFSVGIFIFIHNPSNLLAMPVIEGLSLFCTVCFLIITFIYSRRFQKTRLVFRSALKTLRQALPIGASDLAWAARVYFATIILGFIIGGNELGWFTASHRIVIALHSFVWLYYYNLLPSIARTSQHTIDQLQHLMRTSMQVTGWVGLFIGLMASIFSGYFFTLLFGPEYEEGARAFQILIWMIPLALMSGHYRYILIGYGQQLYELISSLTGLVFAAIIGILLIPKFGFYGAAWCLVLSEVFIWIIAYAFVRTRITKIPILPYLWRPILGGLGASIACFFLLPINVWLAGSAAVVIYAAIFAVAQPDLFSRIFSFTMHSQAH